MMLNVHLFSKTDSSYVVNFIIRKVVKDKYDTDHAVAKSIDGDFYINDFIKS